MNRKLLAIGLALFLGFNLSAQLNTNEIESEFAEDENNKTHSMFIWVPGILTKGVSLFINKEEEPDLKHTLRFLGGMKIRILEGNSNSAKWKRKTNRWERKVKRKNLDDLMVVKNADTVVHLKAGLPGNGKIRNYAFLVNTDGTAVLLLGKSKLDLKKLVKLVEKISS